MENEKIIISSDNLKEVIIVTNGQENGYKSTIIVNGVQLLDGIKDIEIKITPNAKPVLSVEYNERLITDRIRLALGIK